MDEHPQPPVRVVIVDDEEIQRLGTVAALTTDPARTFNEGNVDDRPITLIAALDVDAALTYDWATAAPDVVLLDAWTPAPVADNEHYFGVQVAEDVHRVRGAHTIVIVLTNHSANPALGWRLREAGVTAMVPRARVTTRERLRALVLAPHHADTVIRDTDTEPDLGLGHGLHLNALLRSIRADPRLAWIYTGTERPTSTEDPTRYRHARTERARAHDAGLVRPPWHPGDPHQTHNVKLIGLPALRKLYGWWTGSDPDSAHPGRAPRP